MHYNVTVRDYVRILRDQTQTMRRICSLVMALFIKMIGTQFIQLMIISYSLICMQMIFRVFLGPHNRLILISQNPSGHYWNTNRDGCPKFCMRDDITYHYEPSRTYFNNEGMLTISKYLWKKQAQKDHIKKSEIKKNLINKYGKLKHIHINNNFFKLFTEKFKVNDNVPLFPFIFFFK